MKYVSYINSDVLSETTNGSFEFEYVDIGSVSFGSGIQKTEKTRFSSAPSRARRLVKNGDVIVSTVRTYLRAIAPIKEHAERYVVSTGFCVVTPVGEIKSEYCSYMLQSPYFVETVVAGSVGVSYPATNASDIANIDIPLPQKQEQTKIATFLDRETKKIDRLIEKQQQLIKLLQEKRQAVISHAVTKGLANLSGTNLNVGGYDGGPKGERMDSASKPKIKMKESGVEWLGGIPEHWIVSRLKYLTKLIIDGAHFTPTYVGEGVPFLRVTDLHNDVIDRAKVKYIPLDEHEQLIKRCKPKKGDLLLSKNGTIGLTKIVSWDWEFSIFVHCCPVNFHSKAI